MYTWVNIYAPNDDCPQFFREIDSILDQFQCNKIIYGGDFNFVFNLVLDKKGGIKRTNFKARSEMRNFMEKRCLIDIWRNMNPSTKSYTWKSNGKPPILCRLDYFIITKTLKACIENCTISHGYRTDHSLISLVFNNNHEKTGKGYWKLNVSLLNDADYVNLVKKEINNIVKENSEADPGILWETIKCVVRGSTIRYSVKKARDRNKLQKSLEDEITNLEMSYAQNCKPDILSSIDIKQKELESMYNYNAKGAMIRSRARWVEDGEKNSKYFLNLEKRHFTKKKNL